MKITDSTKLSILPFQTIEVKEGVYIRRGISQFCVKGEQVAEIVKNLQRALTQNSLTLPEILALFSGADRDSIRALLGELVKRRFVVPMEDVLQVSGKEDKESAEDIFYWHFNQTGKRIENLNSGPMAIVGANKLGLAVCQALSRSHAQNITLIDDIPLRNIDYSQPDGQLNRDRLLLQEPVIIDSKSLNDDKLKAFEMLVVCAEFGGRSILREWNRYALQFQLPFVPVFLDDLIGYVGPLVFPKETACLECFYARQNSHLTNFKERQALKQHDREGQKFVAYHPAMLNVLAEVAAFEILRFRTNMWQHKIGKLVEIDLISSSMTTRKVIKAPRCPACSSLHDFAPPNTSKKQSSEEMWENLERMGGDYKRV